MMDLTPEILARAVVAESDWRQCELASGELDFDRLRTHIVAALRTYGEACAASQRETDAQAVVGIANALPADVDDGFYAGYKHAIVQAIAAIRSS